MKIVVNIHCLHPPLTGIGHYARNLLLLMLADDRVSELVGISHRGWHSREELADIVAHSRGYVPEPSMEPLPEAWPMRFSRRLAGRMPGMGRLRARLNHSLKVRDKVRYRGFIYWEPNYLLLPVANPALVTVHDLSHLRFPQYHPPERLHELRLLPDSLRRAKKIATVSEFTRRELADFFSLDPRDIALVPPAVSGLFQPQAEEAHARVKARYRLPENFVLYTGTIEPRKNLPRLLQAFCELPEELQSRFKLVLAGSDGWHGQQFEEAFQGVDSRHVIRLGYIHREDMPALFSAATVLAYPSLYEGFGMPILEAMACGTPVVTANAASLPEVAEGAALLVDPLSPSDIQQGLRRVLEDAELRATMISDGLAVASRHSWSNTMEKLLAALSMIKA